MTFVKASQRVKEIIQLPIGEDGKPEREIVQEQPVSGGWIFYHRSRNGGPPAAIIVREKDGYVDEGTEEDLPYLDYRLVNLGMSRN